LKGQRIQILVEVYTDQVPGWGNEPKDFVELIERNLSEQIPHYNPVVTLLPTDDWKDIDEWRSSSSFKRFVSRNRCS
jgi:hypothetical protein